MVPPTCTGYAQVLDVYGNAVLKEAVKKFLGKLGEDGLANRDQMLEAVLVGVKAIEKESIKKAHTSCGLGDSSCDPSLIHFDQRIRKRKENKIASRFRSVSNLSFKKQELIKRVEKIEEIIRNKKIQRRRDEVAKNIAQSPVAPQNSEERQTLAEVFFELEDWSLERVRNYALLFIDDLLHKSTSSITSIHFSVDECVLFFKDSIPLDWGNFTAIEISRICEKILQIMESDGLVCLSSNFSRLSFELTNIFVLKALTEFVLNGKKRKRSVEVFDLDSGEKPSKKLKMGTEIIETSPSLIIDKSDKSEDIIVDETELLEGSIFKSFDCKDEEELKKSS